MFLPERKACENAASIQNALRQIHSGTRLTLDGSEESVLTCMALFHFAIRRYTEKNGKPPLFLYTGERIPCPPIQASQNARLFVSRDLQPASWPRDGVICEIGTWKGTYAKQILEQAAPSRLHLVDVTFAELDMDYFGPHIESGRVLLHESRSHDAIPRFEDDYFDVVYFDGDHSYSGVVSDIQDSLPKVKKGGLMVFNDYTVYSPLDGTPYGVLNAVNQLLCAEDVEIAAFALNPYGYNDITLRKK